jgi:hypothetical protein
VTGHGVAEDVEAVEVSAAGLRILARSLQLAAPMVGKRDVQAGDEAAEAARTVLTLARGVNKLAADLADALAASRTDTDG